MTKTKTKTLRLLVAVVVILPGIILQGTSLRPSTTTAAAASRRKWLSSTAASVVGAASAAATAPRIANAEPSVVSKVQGPVQDLLAPGHWIGQVLGLNSRTETWSFPNHTPEQVSKALVDVLEDLTPERRSKLCMPEFTIRRADDRNVHVLAWTKLEWLDALDVRFAEGSPTVRNGQPEPNGCVAKASFYATGFLPTTIPGAPILNVGLAFVPFASPGPRGEMLQEFRLRALKGLVTKKLEEKTVTPDLYMG